MKGKKFIGDLICGCVNKKHFAGGMCQHCYQKSYYKTHPEFRKKSLEWGYTWRRKNKKRVNERRRLNHSKLSIKERQVMYLKKRFKMTIEDYENLYKLQNGKCAICEKHEDVLCVDHNHVTMKIRGLLCKLCNLALGNFRENILSLKNAVKYIRRYK